MSADTEPETAPADEESDPGDLAARLELLREENRRLRGAYGRVRQTRHRRTAFGLASIGAVALGGAALFPAARTVLVVLGATGLFGGLLTWYLTPERFIAADVGERVYDATTGNEAAVAAELGLAERHRYVPLDDVPYREAVLYVSQSGGDDLPDEEALEHLFVAPDDPEHRGLSLRPTGEPLLAELREAAPGGLATEPGALVDQLADGLREQFELVDRVQTEVDVDDGRASLAIAGSAYGRVDRFDHPVASLFATGLAVGLGSAVDLGADRTPDGQAEYLVTARWSTDEEGGEPAEGEPTDTGD